MLSPNWSLSSASSRMPGEFWFQNCTFAVDRPVADPYIACTAPASPIGLKMFGEMNSLMVSKGTPMIRLTHAGYHIRRILQEAYGPQQMGFLKAGGFLVKSDYGEYYADSARPLPAPDERPFLAGLDREDPESRLPGSALSSLFQAQVPRFHFSSAEQRVLARAIMDEADADVAEALGVSGDAIKKIWRRIYERVAAVDHDLLGGGLERSAVVRGKEKRRRLVRYIRYHLEELRPFGPRPVTGSRTGT